MGLLHFHLSNQAKTALQNRLLLTVCGTLSIYLVFLQSAKADFVGDYSVSDFTLTNTPYPVSSNGTAVSNDGGQTVIITGGDSGTALPGSTDWTIEAVTSGIVQFDWSYSPAQKQLGCGLNFAGPCDDAGFVLGQPGLTLQQDLAQSGLVYTELASDPNQSSGVVSFAVTAGQIFGFQVDTYNQGLPASLTISDFSVSDPSPTPEPSMPAVLVVLAFAILVAQRQRNRNWLHIGERRI